jgi:hypothetical protein
LLELDEEEKRGVRKPSKARLQIEVPRELAKEEITWIKYIF